MASSPESSRGSGVVTFGARVGGDGGEWGRVGD